MIDFFFIFFFFSRRGVYVYRINMCNYSPGWNNLCWSWMEFKNIKTYQENAGGRGKMQVLEKHLKV